MGSIPPDFIWRKGVARFVCGLRFGDDELYGRLPRLNEDGASYKVDFTEGSPDRSKMMSMAGCLPNTKRFRHGRPDRGRC